MKIAILPKNVECWDGLRWDPTTTKGTGTFVAVLDLAGQFVSICNS